MSKFNVTVAILEAAILFCAVTGVIWAQGTKSNKPYSGKADWL